MKPSKDISRLIEIMAALRHPETGCPWDIEQNFRTIAPYTIEEAYEVADAIERGNRQDLCEELGDLLLQVVYHARMAEEEQSFKFGDVVEAINTKMINRHPHVFGDQKARDAGMAKGAWERIKSQEKRAKAARNAASGDAADNQSAPGLLDDVPANMPAITRALKLQQKAATVGFDWNNQTLVFAKMREEIDELEQALNSGIAEDIEAETGDIFFTMVNLARHLGIDPEASIRRCNNKFTSRFAFVEKSVNQSGKELQDCPLDELEALWQQAKATGL